MVTGLSNILIYSCKIGQTVEGGKTKKVLRSRLFPFLSDKPEIVAGESNITVGSWNNNDLTLQCVARGVPTASFRWFKPGGGEITTNVNPFKGGSRVTVTTSALGDYGRYKCRVNNSLGFTDHTITVNQWREYQTQNHFKPCAGYCKIVLQYISKHTMTTSTSRQHIFKQLSFQMLIKRQTKKTLNIYQFSARGNMNTMKTQLFLFLLKLVVGRCMTI